jgi:hypothetical protein
MLGADLKHNAARVLDTYHPRNDGRPATGVLLSISTSEEQIGMLYCVAVAPQVAV